nr:nonstructural protein [Flumine marna-like virus 2]
MNRVSIRCSQYMEGKRTFPIFSGALKDEAMKEAKIAINKIRVFYGGPVDFTITMRKFLLSFVRVVQKNKFIFEQAPGTEAQSVEWDFIRHYLTQHGEDNCIFGDFGDFDISMLTEFLLIAFESIAKFHEACGCSAEHVRAIRALGYDIAFCLVDFNGDLIEFFGKNPSGQALTVIINGIVNCLYMRYVYLKSNPKQEVVTFRSNVALITYGDDNGMGVSKLCPWFNHTAIANVLASIGVKYTMADKDAVSVPYIHIDQGSFLKRTWRFEPETGTYVCPLEEDSIVKSLMIGVTSREVSPEVQGTEIIQSAMSEWYWYGKQIFEEKRVFLTQLIKDCELVEFMNRPLPTWEQFTNRYMRNSNTFLSDTVIPAFVDENHLNKIREFALSAVKDVAQIDLETKFSADTLIAQDLSLTHLDLSGLREFAPVEEASSSCSEE